MTNIKLCGLSRMEDIRAANALHPDYIGFVFAPKSRRFVSPQTAKILKQSLSPHILAVGVFVDAPLQIVAALLCEGVIDLAQLHSTEDETYIAQLRSLTDKLLIQAFCVKTARGVQLAEQSSADFILLDAGAGSGTVFNWDWLRTIQRPYFLAGGLDASNVREAIRTLHPFAVDVSSDIEYNHKKDLRKMTAFVDAVRKEDNL